jgi:hypothetical protein
MSLRAFLAALLLPFALSAWGQDEAFTNRSTELKDRGASEAKTLATLPENTAVKVLARAGGWTRVAAAGQNGWLRVFHLRFPASLQSTSSTSAGGFLSGVTSLLGGGRQSGQTSTIATTGIRGLSSEDVKNANPDEAALAKMRSFRADKPAAERFAREAKLAAVALDYADEASATPPKGSRR